MSNQVLIPLATVPDWLFWSVIIVFGGIAVLLFVILPVVMFCAAFFETVHIPTYDPEPAERIRSHPALDAALKNGFTLLGHFTDGDKGIGRGVMSFALSPDGVALLRAVHGEMVRHAEIITRFPDKRWLITLDAGSVTDLTGIDIFDTLHNALFETLLKHHLSRLASPARPLPFLPHTAIADARQHFRDRVDLLEKSGWARYRNLNRSTWK
jgi:hypothetical protein